MSKNTKKTPCILEIYSKKTYFIHYENTENFYRLKHRILEGAIPTTAIEFYRDSWEFRGCYIGVNDIDNCISCKDGAK